VRSTDRDVNTGFADFQAAEPVGHRYAMNGETFLQVLSDFGHFAQRHGLVGLVFEIKRGSIVGMIAHKSIEGNNRAIFWATNASRQLRNIESMVHQLYGIG